MPGPQCSLAYASSNLKKGKTACEFLYELILASCICYGQRLKTKNKHHPDRGRWVWQNLFSALLGLFYSILTNLH